MCAASKSHSPNKCKMLLHFGLVTANAGRFSFVIDKIAVWKRGENLSHKKVISLHAQTIAIKFIYTLRMSWMAVQNWALR